MTYNEVTMAWTIPLKPLILCTHNGKRKRGISRIYFLCPTLIVLNLKGKLHYKNDVKITNGVQNRKDWVPKPLTTNFQAKKVDPSPLTSTQATPRFVPKICVHMPSPQETPADLRCSRPSVGHGEVFTPVMAKLGVKHVEESLPHMLKRVGIVPIPLVFPKMVDVSKSVLAGNSRIICRLIGEMPNTFDCTSSIALGRLPQLPS